MANAITVHILEQLYEMLTIYVADPTQTNLEHAVLFYQKSPVFIFGMAQVCGESLTASTEARNEMVRECQLSIMKAVARAHRSTEEPCLDPPRAAERELSPD